MDWNGQLNTLFTEFVLDFNLNTFHIDPFLSQAADISCIMQRNDRLHCTVEEKCLSNNYSFLTLWHFDFDGYIDLVIALRQLKYHFKQRQKRLIKMIALKSR